MEFYKEYFQSVYLSVNKQNSQNKADTDTLSEKSTVPAEDSRP